MNKTNIIKDQSRYKIPYENLKIGILGSGLMGHGIALSAALNGNNVIMLDKSQKKAERGLHSIKYILNKGVKNGFYNIHESKESFPKFYQPQIITI